jgi:hypothetical protein
MAMRLGRTIGGAAVRGLGFFLALWGGSMAGPEARGQTPAVPVSLDQLLWMSPAELETLYRQGTVAGIPPGRVRGTALLAPGTRQVAPGLFLGLMYDRTTAPPSLTLYFALQE